jgi:hypothetical protein
MWATTGKEKAMQELTAHEYIQLRDEFIFRLRVGDVPLGCETVLHWSGAALLILNNSKTINAVVRVDESDDGGTWTPVGITTYQIAQQLAVSVVPQSMATTLILSSKPIIRVKLDNPIGEGVFLHLFQWRPIGQEATY